jgi:soluble lytic murein transglycosylase-like protein
MDKTRYNQLITGLIAGLGLLILLVPIARADIFKYVDKNGRVYLTDKPTHEGYKLLIKTWKGWEEKKSSWQDYKKNRQRFTPAIDRIAARHQLSNALVHAVIKAESSYDPNARSSAGAVGLMQLMPATAQVANMEGGTRYLKDLLGMFNNDLTLALAAYNAGENAVKRYNNQIPPYEETRHYVNKVLGYYKEYKASM